MPRAAAALMLAQSDLPEPAAGIEAEAIHAEFVAAGACEALVPTGPVEAEAPFDARRLAYPALALGGTVTGEHGVGLLNPPPAWSASSAPRWWRCSAR